MCIRDRGSQFTSEAFTGVLKGQQIRISMDGKGRALDNIFVESGGPGLLDRILPGLSGFLRFRLPAGSAANQSTRYRGFCRQARNVGAVHCKT